MAKAQPEGRGRKKPGTAGEGKYYRIVVRSKEKFVTFRYHDVGEPGGILRLAGRRSSGSWDDQAWLISKQMAHVPESEKPTPAQRRARSENIRKAQQARQK